MIIPLGFNKFSEALQAGVEIFHYLKELLKVERCSPLTWYLKVLLLPYL